MASINFAASLQTNFMGVFVSVCLLRVFSCVCLCLRDCVTVCV